MNLQYMGENRSSDTLTYPNTQDTTIPITHLHGEIFNLQTWLRHNRKCQNKEMIKEEIYPHTQ